MTYSILKALHLIFMVSYFAGIFYMVRLFVYYKDTDTMPAVRAEILREQYTYMARRLWNIITVPAGILMLAFGIAMLCFNPVLLQLGWFHLKLGSLLGLLGYHFWTWKMIKKLVSLDGKSLTTANLRLRQLNEVATFILFLVIFTVILKQQVLDYAIELSLGFVLVVVSIMIIVKLVNTTKK